ncbi:hypothetical protein [Candidatus Neptunichlamydia sp. REUL1]|uniref:hypothetical protein n=1 Tax=Candidatus Neptunichlamydia sp. REUL1 TaxID=3064277 RepID=UPI002931C4D3|nr:hypothetical protein [Candidatus Neptunochlamydia sp. REUL1]
MPKIKKDVKLLDIKRLLVLFATEIVVWRAFDGFLGKKFSEIIDDFNAQPGHPQVKLVRKENYQIAFKEGIEAHQRGKDSDVL